MSKNSQTAQALLHLEKKLETVLTEVKEALVEHEKENKKKAMTASEYTAWDTFSEDKERCIAP